VGLGDVILPALALMLIMEGMFPFLAPSAWRDAFTRMTMLRDGQLRFVGLLSMVGGLLLLLVSR
jgi:uncharacterized protein YjeT (DUF2065 family)